MPKKKKVHYVDNEKFGLAVHEYVTRVKEAKENEQEIPRVPTYIAECFIDIGKGLAHTRKFIGRTYKEDLISDSVEDCLRRINNYNIDAKTRTGKPNAFAYFTQITYFSFLRTLEKHNKEIKKKLKYTEHAAVQVSVDQNAGDSSQVLKYLDEIRTPWAEEAGVSKKAEAKPKKLEKFM